MMGRTPRLSELRRGGLAVALAAIWASAPLPACTPSAGEDSDAGVPATSRDGSSDAPVASEPLSIDIAASGCSVPDGGTPGCVGAVPLTAHFVPLTTGALTEFRWTFGNDITSQDPTPTVTFTLPGLYDVSVVGGGFFGTVERSRRGFVRAQPQPAGGPCDVSDQCAAPAACVCGSAEDCGREFPTGLCAAPCSNDAQCPASQSCIDLSAAARQVEPQPWATRLCLDNCQSDEECSNGLRCRALPGQSGASVHACFYTAPAALGAACRAPNGTAADDSCATGLCADIGVFGICTLACSLQIPCPTDYSCADLRGVGPVCLPQCRSDAACGDKLLSCQQEPTAGPLSFVRIGSRGSPLCAPQPCLGNQDCGAGALCQRDAAATDGGLNDGHCVPVP